MDKYYKEDNSLRMEVSGDEGETGYLQDSLDQSGDSLQDSFSVPVFTEQAGSLQNSQGFTFGGVPANTMPETVLQTFSGANPEINGEKSQMFGIQTQSPFVSPTFTLSAKPPQSSYQASSGQYIQTQSASATSNTHKAISVDVDSGIQDIKPVFLPGDFASLGLIGLGQQNSADVTISSHNQTVLNSGAFVMSLKNNPGIVTFGQADNQPGEFKSDNSVFTFVKEYDSAKLTPASTENIADISSVTASQTGSKSTRNKQSSKHRPRKNRAQSTSNDSAIKTETQQGGSPSKLDVTDSQNAGEIGFKPSLLDEILTEKKMALLRSPEVIQFLQAQQKKITHGQYTET